MRHARIYPKGNGIFLEGDDAKGAFVVCEGKVKIYKSTRTGRALTTKILPSGSLFGHRSLFAKESYSASAEAFSDAVISRIDGKTLIRFMKRHWPVAEIILQQFATGVREGEDKAREIAFSSARARLAQALLVFAKKNNGQVLVTTQRKEMAQVAGVAPETCVRLIRKFETAGVLRRLNRKSIAILDSPTLQRIAGAAFLSSQ